MKIAAKIAPFVDAARELRPLARWGTRAAVPPSGAASFTKVWSSSAPRPSVPGRLALVALTGAALALGGCDIQRKGDAVISAGTSATGVNTRFQALSANEGEHAFDAASKTHNHITTLGSIKGRNFTEPELKDLNKILRELRPLWRCKEAPLKQFVRVDYLLDGDEPTPRIAGVAYPDAPLIAIGDSAHTTSWSFRSVSIHEVVHKLLQNFDPTTCTEYRDHYANPLVQDYMKLVGWKDEHTLQAPMVAGTFRRERPPTQYGRKSPLEDMADSFVLYMVNRDKLREFSPRRAKFFDEIFEKLEVKPTIALHEPQVFTGEVWNVRRNGEGPPPASRIFQVQFKRKDANNVLTFAVDSDWTFAVSKSKID